MSEASLFLEFKHGAATLHTSIIKRPCVCYQYSLAQGKLSFDVVVEVRQVDVAKQLAGEVANSFALAARVTIFDVSTLEEGA